MQSSLQLSLVSAEVSSARGNADSDGSQSAYNISGGPAEGISMPMIESHGAHASENSYK